jgi:hypothetical protein
MAAEKAIREAGIRRTAEAVFSRTTFFRNTCRFFREQFEIRFQDIVLA